MLLVIPPSSQLYHRLLDCGFGLRPFSFESSRLWAYISRSTTSTIPLISLLKILHPRPDHTISIPNSNNYIVHSWETSIPQTTWFSTCVPSALCYFFQTLLGYTTKYKFSMGVENFIPATCINEIDQIW